MLVMQTPSTICSRMRGMTMRGCTLHYAHYRYHCKWHRAGRLTHGLQGPRVRVQHHNDGLMRGDPLHRFGVERHQLGSKTVRVTGESWHHTKISVGVYMYVTHKRETGAVQLGHHYWPPSMYPEYLSTGTTDRTGWTTPPSGPAENHCSPRDISSITSDMLTSCRTSAPDM